MKKSTKLFTLPLLLFSLSSGSLLASSGENLFKEKCMTCHTMVRPADKSTMVAPPAKGLMFHMSEDIGSDKKILAHIKSFTMNPTKEKAICKSVRRFGLMPSQKDSITQAELDIVAKWMVKNLKMSEADYKMREERRGRGAGQK